MHLLDIANEFIFIVSTTFQEPFPERGVEEHVCVVSSLDQHALQQLKFQKSQNIHALISLMIRLGQFGHFLSQIVVHFYSLVMSELDSFELI
jgi:hypothetical protein